jgi:hypothetical protein
MVGWRRGRMDEWGRMEEGMRGGNARRESKGVHGGGE